MFVPSGETPDDESVPYGLPDDAALERLLLEGDLHADALVDGLGGPDAIAHAFDALIEWRIADPCPPGLPAAVAAFITTKQPDEGTLDPEIVARAQRLFQGLKFSGIAVLACAGLPACYAVRGIATVLTGTGRLVDRVRQRLQDTVYFVSSVMTVGALAEGGLGRRWVRKVRLMHAMMRRLALADPREHQHRTGDRLADLLLRKEWKSPDSVPLSQAELGYVLLTFSWLVLRGWERLGVTIADADRRAYIQTWAWVGRMLGLRRPMRGYADASDPVAGAEALFERVRAEREDKVELRARDGDTNEEGRQLAAALAVVLVEEQREALLGSLLPAMGPVWRAGINLVLDALPDYSWRCIAAMPRTTIRLLVGADTADDLCITRAPLLQWLPGRVILAGVPWRGLALPERPPSSASADGSPRRPRLFEAAPARLTTPAA